MKCHACEFKSLTGREAEAVAHTCGAMQMVREEQSRMDEARKSVIEKAKAFLGYWFTGPWTPPVPRVGPVMGKLAFINPDCRHERTSYDAITCEKCQAYTAKRIEDEKANMDGGASSEADAGGKEPDSQPELSAKKPRRDSSAP